MWRDVLVYSLCLLLFAASGHDAYLEVRDVTQGLMATQETPFASDLIEE